MGLPIDEIVQRRAYNAAADLIDGNVARGLGGKVAFTDPERTLTYGELQARSCQFARALKALGIRQESRVALLLLDTVDFPVAFFGAIRSRNRGVAAECPAHGGAIRLCAQRQPRLRDRGAGAARQADRGDHRPPARAAHGDPGGRDAG